MSAHVPVMLEDVMAVLSPRDDAIYVDATFGGGGYSTALLSRARCSVYAIDRDLAAIARGHALAERFDGRLTLIHGRFSEMEELLAGHGILQADGVAFDLGVSSFQFDEAERGFSFSHDGPLDMRMDSSRGETAAELVNTLPEASLADLLKTYGEENRARRVAHAIVASRPIARTSELAEIVERALPRGGQRIHPATRTFQALRIAVNEELAELERGLVAAECVLKAQGRLAAVSFHSLEDRIVKRFLLSASGRATSFSRHVPAQATAREPTFRLIGKQPRFPGAEEVSINPRARSARLRAAERTAAPCSRNFSMSGELA